MTKTIIIIPCYNEAARLNDESFKSFGGGQSDVKFLFINDGSTDDTLKTLQALVDYNPQGFECLSFPVNKGKAEAVRQGFLKAFSQNPDYIGFWDADLATPLKAILDLCQIFKERPQIDVVMGSRVRLLGRFIERSLFRHYLGRIFATVVSFILRMPVYDTQCGAKIFRVSAITQDLFKKPFVAKWIFDVELIARYKMALKVSKAEKIEEKIYEFPLIEWKDIPGSKLRAKDFLRAIYDLIKIHRLYL